MSFGTVAKIYVSECIFSALKKRWFRDMAVRMRSLQGDKLVDPGVTASSA